MDVSIYNNIGELLEALKPFQAQIKRGYTLEFLDPEAKEFRKAEITSATLLKYNRVGSNRKYNRWHKYRLFGSKEEHVVNLVRGNTTVYVAYHPNTSNKPDFKGLISHYLKPDWASILDINSKEDMDITLSHYALELGYVTPHANDEEDEDDNEADWSKLDLVEDSLYANRHLAELINDIDSATFIDRNALIQLDNNLSMLLIKGDTIIAALQAGEQQTDKINQYTEHRSRICNSFQDILAICNEHLDRNKSISFAMTIGSLKFAHNLAESNLQEQITTMFELVNPVIDSGSSGLAELESDWQESKGQLATHTAEYQKDLETIEREIVDVDDVCFKTVEELRAALLEERGKRITHLERIILLLQYKNSLLVENCTKLVRDLLKVTNECHLSSFN